MANPESHFTCVMCGGIFRKGWTEADAVAEFNENFPGVAVERAALTCNECYKIIMERIDAQRKTLN